MCPSPLFVSAFLLLTTSVFGQERFNTVKDLRPEWTRYDGTRYRPVEDIPLTGLNTIYFELRPRAFAGSFLLLKSHRPYFLFVNGKVSAEYQGQVLINIDSLAREVYGASYRVAVHQRDISERDLRTAIVSARPLHAEAVGSSPKPYSHFRDFVVIAGLIVIVFFVFLVRIHPKLASDYFSVAGIFSSREVDDGQVSSRLTSSANVQFYLLGSALIGFYLFIVFRHLPDEYALPIRFHASGFWMMWWQWLKLSAIVFSILLVKIVIIFSLTRLFGFRGMARYHFFNWIRLLLVVFGLSTILLFMYFISRGDRPDIFVFFLSLVVITLALWIVIAFLKLSGRTGHSMFHLFSYLCATEIIPLLITAKVLFQ